MSDTPPIRKPGVFERALIRSDAFSPFNVVSALSLEPGPAPEVVLAALKVLQGRHPFLRARLGQGMFEFLPDLEFPFRVMPRRSDTHWQEIVETEMNTPLDISAGLFRVICLAGDTCTDLILTFHHAIMDAASGMSLLDELLQRCAGPEDAPLEPPSAILPPAVLPPVEMRFPPAFRGLRGAAALLRYAAAQMGGELGYWLRAAGTPIPKVTPGGRGFTATLVLEAEQVQALSQRCRRERVTLNSLLNAALVLAVNRSLYAGRRVPLRTFTFADLRPYTSPPTPPGSLANYISMLRFTLDVDGSAALWPLAQTLHARIYTALKRGEKFCAAVMSESLMKMFLAFKSMRMGAAALNYSGPVPLRPAYGPFRVTALHGFLSSYAIGPQASAQGRLFNDQLWLDFMFLDTDLDRPDAAALTADFERILLAAVSA